MSHIHANEASKFTEEASGKYHYAKIEGHIAVWGNLLLFAFKFYVGFISQSVAVMADAWHTLSDSISSIVLLIGVRISEIPPDVEHPYGHGRAELIASFAIAMLLVMIGFEFGVQGVKKLYNHETAQYGIWPIAAMVATILVKEAMAQYAFYTARKTGLSSLKADGFHHRSDAVSSLIVLAGIVLNMIFGEKLWFTDGVLAILVALIIFYAAWTVIAEVGQKLMGHAPEPELVDQLKNLCLDEFHFNPCVHKIRLHEYGIHREIVFHLRLNPSMTLHDVHAVITRLEKRIFDEMHLSATIHAEPSDKSL